MRKAQLLLGMALVLSTSTVGALGAEGREEPKSSADAERSVNAEAPTAPAAPPAVRPGTPRQDRGRDGRLHPGYRPTYRPGYGPHFRGYGSVWMGPWGFGPVWGGYTAVYPDGSGRFGALDLDVDPERAEVWIDGWRIGIADDFDGFPTHLWLEPGTYDVVLYLPDFKTLARQMTIYPGLVIDVEDRLEPGEAVHPDDLGPKSHVRRDERLRRDRETAAEAELRAGGLADQGGTQREAELDARSEPGRIELTVAPEDASVYLDGRFLGTGRELAGLRSGLLVDPGTHTLEVVRPGYTAERREITIEAGEHSALELELERGGD